MCLADAKPAENPAQAKEKSVPAAVFPLSPFVFCTLSSFYLGCAHAPLFILSEAMFLWICFYFGMRCWPSVLQIISWLCPWCQVTLRVTAEHLLAVASEKARDTCCSVIKKSELTPRVTQQHFFAACYKRGSHTFISPTAYSPGTNSSLNFCRCNLVL